MAETLVVRKDALATLALPVPAGTTKGNAVLLGANGLRGFTQTDQATAANALLGRNAPGLAVGEASVILIGVSLVANLSINAALNQYDKVYMTAAGVYTPTATGNTFVGYALATLAAAGNVRVAIALL